MTPLPLRRDLLYLASLTPLLALPRGLDFLPGPSNGLVLRKAGKNLVVYGDPTGKLSNADFLLSTHARRDITWSADKLVLAGATAVVPQQEARLFSAPQDEWRAIFTQKRLHDYDNQVTRFPLRAWSRVRAVQGGDQVDWNGLPVRVVATPGYTRGAVSYVFDWEGQKIAATGDLIYAGARLFDIYSLQDAIPALKVRGYHGFASRLAELMTSLRRIADLRPDLLVPARGPLITNPAAEISRLLDRLSDLYANYLKTDAYRWYFGQENYEARARRVLGDRKAEGLPYAETIERQLPPWMRAVSNSRLIVSASGEALLVDCGSRRVMEQVRAWRDAGVFRKLRAIYITHYHDDHTDFAQAAANEFGAELWSSSEQQEILREPARFRMPCLTPNPIPGLQPWKDRETRDWHEFRLRNFHFPGQTLFHGALLVEPKAANSAKVLFVGDSFTPSGVDDYCLLNRNLLHPRQGLLYCLQLLEEMPDAMLVNQHVEPLFRFSAEQRAALRRSLEERIKLLRDLVPFPEANFGVDEQWLRLDPYVSVVAPGQRFRVQAKLLHHAAAPQRFRLRLEAPAGWRLSTPSQSILVQGGEEATLSWEATAPAQASGIQVLSASVQFAQWDLRQWTEALVEVKA